MFCHQITSILVCSLAFAQPMIMCVFDLHLDHVWTILFNLWPWIRIYVQRFAWYECNQFMQLGLEVLPEPTWLISGTAAVTWKTVMQELNKFSGQVYHVMGNHEFYAFTHAEIAQKLPTMTLPDIENPQPGRKRLRYRCVLFANCQNEKFDTPQSK